MECPSDQDYLSVISKSYYQYPYIEFNGKFGPLDSATGVYRIGLEYGSGAMPYHIQLVQDGDTCYLELGSKAFHPLQLDVTTHMPSDLDTADHRYTLQVDEGMVFLFIDGRLRGVAATGQTPVTSSGSAELNSNAEPYSVGVFESAKHHTMPLKIENHDPGTTLGFPAPNVVPSSVQVKNGSPYPMRTFRLHSGSRRFGQLSIDSKVTSHPLPLAGREGTFIFQADTDSTSDGLAIEVFNRGWNTYKTYTYSTGEPFFFNLYRGKFQFVRLSYEPASSGASVSEASYALGGRS